MTQFEAMVMAAWVGAISGFLISVPVGPVNLTIMSEAARAGFLRAALVGLGAVTMEVIYCAVAFTGFASLFAKGTVQSAMELVSFVFLVFLGFKFLMARSVVSPTRFLSATDRLEARIEARLHPHTAFMTGLVRVLANPGVLLFWIILAANFLSRGWVGPGLPERLACVAGVTAGVACWFLGLSWAASLGCARLSERGVLWMEKLSGVALLIMALWHGVRLVNRLAAGAG